MSRAKARPQRAYFDTTVFRELGKAFENNKLPGDVAERVLISPITVFEVLSQLTVAKAKDVLRDIHSVLNWTNPNHTGLLPWPDDALRGIWFKKPAPDDGFTERMQRAFNTCLATGSADELQEEAGRLKDAMDGITDKTAQDFERLLQAARKEGIDDEKFSKWWLEGIANRLKTKPEPEKMSEIISELSAYHEFEKRKLETALANANYNPHKHKNDLLDAEQLIYLSDPSLCFLTCDKGFTNLVQKSPQANRIIMASPSDLANSACVERMLRGIFS